MLLSDTALKSFVHPFTKGGGDGARGMLFCGTGMGVGIIANKFSGVYAATVENEAAARNSRAINNSNVLCMGGMVI